MIEKIMIIGLLSFLQIFSLVGCRDKNKQDIGNMVQNDQNQNADTYETINGVQNGEIHKENDFAKYPVDNSSSEKENGGFSGEEYYENFSKGNFTLKDLSEALNSVIQEEYWPNEVVEEAGMQEILGISPEQYSEAFFERSHLKDNLDQFVIIDCKEKEVENLELALEKYRDNLIVDHKDQPINYAKANASRIEIIGNYICFVLLGGDLSQVEGEEEKVNICQEQNEKAIDILEKILAE